MVQAQATLSSSCMASGASGNQALVGKELGVLSPIARHIWSRQPSSVYSAIY